MRVLHVDLETYSSSPLPKCGVYRYCDSPDFEILLLSYAFDDEPVVTVDLACGERMPDEFLQALEDANVLKIAHNAVFERVCFSKHLGRWLDPAQWRCTMVMAWYSTLPGRLADVAVALNVTEKKMEEGKDLIRYFSVPCKPTKTNGGRTRNLPQHAPEKWATYKAYNAQDVETERAVYKALLGHPLPEHECALYALDQRINDRGVRIDRLLVKQAMAVDLAFSQQAFQRAQELTGLDNPGSVSQLKAWLADMDMPMESLSKRIVQEKATEAEGIVKELLELRLELSKTSIKKYEAMARTVCKDGRVHGMLQFYGASRTGRWCLTGDHEILTNEGWKRLDEWDGGYVDPVIWNEVTGNIVGGHQRYKVLKAEGVTEIDCVVVHIEDPQEEKALNIALNKAVGEWEPKALADMLADLQFSGYDLGATGFDAAEIDDLFSQVHDKEVKDDNCELDAEEIAPFVQPGDVWTLGRHRMVCGDATDPEDVARLMDGLKANLVVTDPPYNVGYESADGKSIQNDSMADGKFFEFLLSAFRNMAAHMAEGASAYIFHADTEGLNFRRAFKEAGFHISGVCIWVKNSLVLGRSPYQWQHEPVLFGWLPNGKHKWFSDRKQSTIWNFDKPKKSAQHPTMKPIPLLAYPIKNSSAPNGVVMDLFGGSGSTLMACEQTDRICRTMELDPRYASVIVMRYKTEYPNAPVHVLRDGQELSYEAVCQQHE